MEEMFDNWDNPTPLPDLDKELKAIRANLNRHNRNIILTAIALVLALILTTSYIVAPALEKLYWAPYTSDYVQQGNDLKWTLQAYTELFYPGKQIVSVYANDNGFATYDLTISRMDTATGEAEYIDGRLVRGTLELDYPLYEYDVKRAYLRGNNNFPENVMTYYRDGAIERLNQLPSFVAVEAVVFFPEDLTMEQVQQLIFRYDYNTAYDYEIADGVAIKWVGVRNMPKDAENTTFAMGFSTGPNGDLALLDEHYPEMGMYHTKEDGSHMEEHFKSLLRFSADQLDKGKGIPIVTLTGNHYRDVLNYVEENGVMSYGCLVTGTPAGLLSMLEDGVASTLILTDGWIDIG